VLEKDIKRKLLPQVISSFIDFVVETPRKIGNK
jgi:hypothetical protein